MRYPRGLWRNAKLAGAILITFRIVDTSEVGRAYAWHAAFASANDAIFPRTEKAFDVMAMERQLWCAITDADDIVGMSYATVNEEESEAEVGGLMVAPSMRGKGVGDVLMFLPLAHFLVNEQPLSWDCPPRIVTHALQDNMLPRGIIARVGFHRDRDVVIPGSALPGLRTGADGNVHGVEFHFKVPESLHPVADWLDEWAGVLKDGTPATIEMREGELLASWAMAIRDMA